MREEKRTDNPDTKREQQPAAGAGELTANPNPRANENLVGQEVDDTEGTGSEITDGEAG